jgi:urease accessory protein
MSARRLSVVLLCLVALCLGAGAAEAHLVSTGLGPLYDGVSHFALSPDDLVPVVALALLAGLRGPEAGRRAVFILPIAWFIGGLAGLALPAAGLNDLPWLLFVIFGGLIAADVKVPSLAIGGLAVLLGFFHGFLNGTAVSAGPPGISELAGVGVMVFVMTTLVSAATIYFSNPVGRIAVRVLGSWTAATGVLLFGWSLRCTGSAC